MKKIIACIMAVSLLAAMCFSGCSFGGNAPQDSSAAESGADAAPQQDAEPAAEEIVLRMPHWFFSNAGGYPEWINGAIADFEQNNPGVKVDGYGVAYADYLDKLDSAIAAGNAPDVACLANFNMGKYIANNQLAALDDLVDMNAINQNFAAVQTQGIPARAADGKTYIVACNIGFYLPMYRPSFFEAAGISAYPKTPEEFVEMAKTYSATAGNKGYGVMINPGNYNEGIFDLCIWIIGMGSHYCIDGKPAFNTPEMKQVFGYYKQLYDANAIVKETDKTTYQKMFAEGKVGTLIDGAWMYEMCVDWDPTVASDFAIADLPFATQHAAAFFEGYSVLEQSKYKEQAAKLVEALTSQEQQRRFCDLLGQLPSRNDVFSDESFQQSIYERWPWIEKYIEHSNDAILFDPSGIPMDKDPELQKTLYGALERVLYENVSIDQALEEAQAEGLAILGM